MTKNILYLTNVSALSNNFVPKGQLLIPFKIFQGQHFWNVQESGLKQNMGFLNIT
jgi:hypothetical protein